MSGKECLGYIVAQLIGATVGAAFLYALFNLGDGFHYGGITDASGSYLATNVLQNGATPAMALLTEALLTFFFVMVILGATDAKKGFGKFAGLAIGLALGLVNIVGIPVDNCSVNPARSFGPVSVRPLSLGRFLDYGSGSACGRSHSSALLGAMTNDKKSVE